MKRFAIILGLILAFATIADGAYYYNTAGKVYMYAWDTANNCPKTGDAANITPYRSIDGDTVAPLGDATATERSADYMPGIYVFDLTADELTCQVICITAITTTDDVYIQPVTIAPLPKALATIAITAGNIHANVEAIDANTATPALLNTQIDNALDDAAFIALVQQGVAAQGGTPAAYGYITTELPAAYTFIQHMFSSDGTEVAGVTDARQFTLDDGSAANDWYNGKLCVVQDVSDSDRRSARYVQDYIGASKTVILESALPFLPAVADEVYFIVPPAGSRGRVSP